MAATHRSRRPLRGEDAIGLRVGRVIGRLHMAKHFERGPSLTRRQGTEIGARQGQGCEQDGRRRHTLAQLQDPAAGPRDAGLQHDLHPPQSERQDRHHHAAHASSG